MYDPYTQTGGYGGAQTPPGSNYGIDPAYQQMYQQQQNYLQRQLAAAYPILIPATSNTLIPKEARAECSEFTWLRNRVNEILWK